MIQLNYVILYQGVLIMNRRVDETNDIKHINCPIWLLKHCKPRFRSLQEVPVERFFQSSQSNVHPSPQTAVQKTIAVLLLPVQINGLITGM